MTIQAPPTPLPVITPIQLPGTNTLQIFYPGSDNVIHTNYREAGGGWNGDAPLGVSISSDVAALVAPSADVQLFYKGADGQVHTITRLSSSGEWTPDVTLGGQVAGDITAMVLPGSATVQLFYRGTDGNIHTNYTENAAYSENSGWKGDLALTTANGDQVVAQSDIAAVTLPGTQVVQLFYQGGDHQVHTIYREGGTWSNDVAQGGSVAGDITATAIPNAGIVVLNYVSTTDGRAHTMERSAEGGWCPDTDMGYPAIGEIAAIVLPGTQVLQVFFRDQSSQLQTQWKEDWSQPGQNWSKEHQLAGEINSDVSAMALPNDAVVQVFFTDTSNTVYTSWREENGDWADPRDLGGTVAAQGS